MTGNSLYFLRFVGALSGLAFLVWGFDRFRSHVIRRLEFTLTTFLGLSLVLVALYPNSVNVIAGMFSLKNEQYGRLITLLIISNMLLWLLVVSLRVGEASKAMQFDLLVRHLAKKRFEEKFPAARFRDVMVIIPALNEAENLDAVLPRMPQKVAGHPLGVLVVDDGSDDGTAVVTEKHGFLSAVSPINRGGGAALRLGYDLAMQAGSSIVVTMDADGQHLPEEIDRLVRPILDDECDIVIGSRVKGEREKDSLVRWVGIHVFNGLINFLAGTSISDCSSGFRAYRVESLRKVLLLQDQFHTAELIIDAARKGARIHEAPVTIRRRLSGQSKKGMNLTYGYSFFRTIVKTWWRPK